MSEESTHNLPDRRSFKGGALEQKVDSVERKLNVFWRDMLTLRNEQVRLEDRMDKLEPEHAR